MWASSIRGSVRVKGRFAALARPSLRVVQPVRFCIGFDHSRALWRAASAIPSQRSLAEQRCAMGPLQSTLINRKGDLSHGRRTISMQAVREQMAKLSFKNVWAQVKQHGPAAIVIYSSAWAATFGAAYALSASTGNFGIVDPLSMLPDMYRNYIHEFVGLKPADVIPGWQVSLLLAYLAADVLELPRVALTLWAAPQLTAWWKARKAAKARSAAITNAR